MARRRRRSGNINGIALLFALGLIALAVLAAIRFWPVTVTLLAIAAGVVVFRRKRRRATAARTEREAAEAWEANRQAWRAMTFDPGTFSVALSGFREHGAEADVIELLSDLPDLRDQSVDEIEALVQRAAHVKPQDVADGISQQHAIGLKEALERRGAKARIKEGVPKRANGNGREPIPEKVRNEVWRRDEGRCVECGSRERLEYDHIIAVANGGSNTARNIELRCETCNRKKGAKI